MEIPDDPSSGFTRHFGRSVEMDPYPTDEMKSLSMSITGLWVSSPQSKYGISVLFRI